jgi:3-phenylpropionate/trans-cinnamate dioxygenase ferredoxin reductase subunit
MADRHLDHLLIGGGIASATAARTLREEGAGGSIAVVGRELDAPYHRPPVTKGYLQGAESREDALIAPAGWWEEAGVELLTRTSVLSLDPAARTATLSTKETVSFGTALVATGAMIRRLQVDGADLDGLHYLRALGNADALRRDVEGVERVVMVGGSYIGCEVAASLTVLGRRCTVVMLEEEPLERHFGAQAGRFFRGVLEEHGVEVIGGADVVGFGGDGSGEDERVARVLLAGGREVPADAVVCGVGAIPDVMLARKSGLRIGELGGVACDSTLRTSAEGIYAAGDMCEYESVVHELRLRVVHVEHAAAQGATAARNMLGAGLAHTEIPYFFSDLADWTSLEYVGPALDWASEEVDGEVASGSFGIRYLDEEGRVRAALSVGGGGDLDSARAAIAGAQG